MLSLRVVRSVADLVVVVAAVLVLCGFGVGWAKCRATMVKVQDRPSDSVPGNTEKYGFLYLQTVISNLNRPVSTLICMRKFT